MPNVQCWGCEHVFRSAAGMFIHLELGTQCQRPVNQAVIMDAVLKCLGPWRNLETNDTEFLLRCPTYLRQFRFVSALLQHVESPACVEDYFGGSGAMWDFLKNLRYQLGWPDVKMYGQRLQ